MQGQTFALTLPSKKENGLFREEHNIFTFALAKMSIEKRKITVFKRLFQKVGKTTDKK